MTIQLLIFYLLGAVLIASAVMVVSARNTVHSVLFLILCFFNAAGLFILIGAEFLAMVVVVVYVGAVAVLFMFVVMMLDIDFVRVTEGFLHYLPIGALIAFILTLELVIVGGGWAMSSGIDTGPTVQPDGLSNTEALGNLLYTEYVYLFQAAGVILLIAIIGAISLTLRERPNVRRQDVGEQVHRQRDKAVELKDVKTGAGI